MILARRLTSVSNIRHVQNERPQAHLVYHYCDRLYLHYSDLRGFHALAGSVGACRTASFPRTRRVDRPLASVYRCANNGGGQHSADSKTIDLPAGGGIVSTRHPQGSCGEADRHRLPGVPPRTHLCPSCMKRRGGWPCRRSVSRAALSPRHAIMTPYIPGHGTIQHVVVMGDDR